MTYFLLALLLAGLVFLWLGRRALASAGLPRGRVVAVDAFPRRALDRALYDPVYDVSGRPDYLVEDGHHLIPVEVKSGRSHAGPRPGHVLQLAAYCRLVEVHTSRRPPYGILKYVDRAFAVDYSRRLELELTDTLALMRRGEDGPPDRSHESPARCRACGVREACDQRLG